MNFEVVEINGEEILYGDNYLFTGIYQEFYDNGNLMVEYEIKKGKKDGIIKSYSRDGKLEIEGKFKNNKENGEWNFFETINNRNIAKAFNEKGYLKKIEIYIRQVGSSNLILGREIYFLEKTLSSAFYTIGEEYKDGEELIDSNSYCIKGISDRNGYMPEEISGAKSNDLLYSINYKKNGYSHGLHVEIDSFDDKGTIKDISLYENGVEIKDSNKNREKVMSYFFNMDRMPKDGKKMIKRDLKNYKVIVPAGIKFLRGCFLFVILFLALIVFLGYLIINNKI